MHIARKLTLLVAALLVLSFATWTLLSILGFRQQARAEAFLRELTSLKLGEASFSDAERLGISYGGKPWSTVPQGETCTTQECFLLFKFANPRDHLPFALVSRVGLDAIVHVKDGKVISTNVGYQIDSKYGGQAGYEVRASLGEIDSSGNQSYQLLSPGYGIARFKFDKDGAPRFVEVRLNERSTEEERRRAYALNLSCLARLYGCTERSAILPSP